MPKYKVSTVLNIHSENENKYEKSNSKVLCSDNK